MAVIHILKDGTQTDDISGIKISPEEFPTIYSVFREINKEAMRWQSGKNESKSFERSAIG